MIDVTEDMLKEITRKIVDAVNPVSIILFGSYARGNAGPDSDLDFLIVEEEPFGPGRSRRKEMVRVWKLLGEFRIPKDILVYSVEEIKKWKTAKNHLIAHAIREGKIMYERY
jgi:predicted nucleotidyltransferase